MTNDTNLTQKRLEAEKLVENFDYNELLLVAGTCLKLIGEQCNDRTDELLTITQRNNLKMLDGALEFIEAILTEEALCVDIFKDCVNKLIKKFS